MDTILAYEQLKKEYLSVIESEKNEIARLATLVSMLVSTFGARFFWCGFYIVDENKMQELVIGPYMGTLGCLRIPFSRGVCGKAAREEKTQLIDDVHAFPDHIECDSRSNSEIVVPVFKNGKLRAVLDIDSTDFAAFNIDDKIGLEMLCAIIYE